MATLTVLSSDNHFIAHDSGSGIGYFGAGGFGYSVQVGNYNERSFITNENGTTESVELDNLKKVNPSGAVWGVSGDEHQLTEIPNDKASWKIRFTHSSAVLTQNAEIRSYDGSNIDAAPSGVNSMAAYLLHPWSTYENNGSGTTHWVAQSGSAGILNLPDSPGSGGYVAATGGTVTSTCHEFFLATSMSPSSVGAKTGKYYISLEYL